MNTRDIVSLFKNTNACLQLQQLLVNKKNTSILLKGTSGSGIAFVFSEVFASSQQPLCIILPDKESALYMKNDLENILTNETILFLPDSYVKPYKTSIENALHVQERIETLNALQKNNNRILISYTQAIVEYVVQPKELENSSIEISRGQNMDLDFLIEFLLENNFSRKDFVFEPGEFAIRGGIIDIYSFAHENPFRIELDGDGIENIRSFDVNTQLSFKEIAFFSLVPNVQNQINTENVPLFSYLNNNAIICCMDIQLQKDKFEDAYKKNLELHIKTVDLKEEIYPHPKEKYITPKSFESEMQQFTQLHWGISDENIGTEKVVFNQQPQPNFARNFHMLGDWLKNNELEKKTNIVCSENHKQIDRLQTILIDSGSDANFTPLYIGLSGGFVDAEAGIAIVTEHQLFDKYYKPKTRNRYSSNTALTLRELKNLRPGDFVTHIDHGIGRFAGLEKMQMNNITQEVVRIMYKDNDILYVGIGSLHKIAKYTGKDGTAPTLHKLGSPSWEKEKKNTKRKVKDIARELIELYAKRKTKKGFAFAPDNYLQLEMEASFFYEDTPDQSKATDDVKNDMQSEQPMDRLVCGDVGFGKTEVAMRAAFKAVCDSKQVAILVPTTILAQQHYRTFKQRMRGLPVNIDYLNRFKTTAEQKRTLQQVGDGKVDILIGTHRLISKDVKFKDLGLLIIDEEQKFGVGAKEKLKEIRVNVDTLTLTATPIPRTLHFSLMGARDLSIINTPPSNRQPVHTEIHVFNKEIIAEAINFEVNRGGQVFFIHSRVKDIYDMQMMLEDLLPGVKFGVAHGQLEGDALENVMLKFIEGEYDVLIATTIIESGLDIPNANTIIINHAHVFGLSDLHQMRGRVGRSNVKAYCYLLSPPVSTLSDDARKRLRTIEEFNELGSGFQVAMRDLDIRGAGNLLGGEQSGFISEMGFEMYHKILDEAVRELKAEEFPDLYQESTIDISSRDCQVETDYEMLIPGHYVENITERLSLYSDLANIETELQLKQFADQLVDRFGKLPNPVYALLDSVRIKWEGKKLGLEKITLIQERMRLYFPGDANAPVYGSEAFIQMMQHVADNPNKYSLKQTEKALIITVNSVRDVHEALWVLNDFSKTNSSEIKLPSTG